MLLFSALGGPVLQVTYLLLEPRQPGADSRHDDVLPPMELVGDLHLAAIG
jgi:hypothetical protein